MTESLIEPSVWMLGINHESAPLDVRARFAFSGQALTTLLQELHRVLDVESGASGALENGLEAAIVSTCNRTEVYATGPASLIPQAQKWLAAKGGITTEQLEALTYSHRDSEAMRHAFRVACGLDSMVLGEPQILGQMKDAARRAQEAGTLGTTLHQLFQRSFSVAKTVRTETEIGAHSVSMAAAAVRLAAQLFENLSDIRVLFVGAGEMIELAATHFAAKHPREMAICNRSAERAAALCKQYHAEYIPLTQLPDRMADFDAIISCTASSLPIIGLGAVESAIKARRHRPIFMVDLAVPRDIEAQVCTLDDVYLYTLDDLSRVVQTGQEQRHAAAAQAQEYIDAGLADFSRWMHERRNLPLIQSLQERSKRWQTQEIARVKKRLAQGEDVDKALAALASAVSQKMLHGPLRALRSENTHERQLAEQTVLRWYLDDSSEKL